MLQRPITSDKYLTSVTCILILLVNVVCGSASNAQRPTTPDNRLERDYTITTYRDERETLHLTLRGPFPSKQRLSFIETRSSMEAEYKGHYTGTLRSSHPELGGNTPTLSIFGQTAILFMTLPRGKRETAIRFTLPEEAATIPLSRRQVSHLRRHHEDVCIDAEPSTIHAANRTELPALLAKEHVRGSPVKNKPREVEMNVYYDSLYAQRAGSQVEEAISASIFSANERFLKQVGVRVRLKYLGALPVSALTKPSQVAEEILERFRIWNVSASYSADLFHLFTGASIEDSTAGVAFVGSACRNGGRFAVGLSQFMELAMQPIVFAHEVLHGIGARHDNSSYSIMDPILSKSNTRISQNTRTAVTQFSSKYGRCIGHPKSLGATINLKSSEGLFTAEVELRNPPPKPCHLSLVGRMPPGSESTRGENRDLRWTRVIDIRLPATTPVSHALIRLRAKEPPVGQSSPKEIQIQASVICRGAKVTTTPQQLILTSTETPVGASLSLGSNWLNSLGRAMTAEVYF